MYACVCPPCVSVCLSVSLDALCVQSLHWATERKKEPMLEDAVQLSRQKMPAETNHGTSSHGMPCVDI